MSTEPQKFKKKLEASIKALQPNGYVYDIAVCCGYSHEYVRKWFRSNLVQDTIYENAKQHLVNLKADDAARLEEVKAIAK